MFLEVSQFLVHRLVMWDQSLQVKANVSVRALEADPRTYPMNNEECYSLPFNLGS